MQRFIKFVPCFNIKIGVRLIEQQELRLPDDSSGQQGALPLSAAQLANRIMRQRCQSQTFHDLRTDYGRMFFLLSGGEQAFLTTTSHHLFHCDRKGAVHLRDLGQNSHAQIFTPLHRAALGLPQPGHNAQQGGLSTTIAPREHPYLSFADFHGKIAHHHMKTIGNPNLVQRKQHISFHQTKLWRYATTLSPSHTTRDLPPAPRHPPPGRWHLPLCRCVRAARRRYAHLRNDRSE